MALISLNGGGGISSGIGLSGITGGSTPGAQSNINIDGKAYTWFDAKWTLGSKALGIPQQSITSLNGFNCGVQVEQNEYYGQGQLPRALVNGKISFQDIKVTMYDAEFRKIVTMAGGYYQLCSTKEYFNFAFSYSSKEISNNVVSVFAQMKFLSDNLQAKCEGQPLLNEVTFKTFRLDSYIQ